jgi:hypothetical protein
MSPASLLRVKRVIRSFTRQRARALLDTALGLEEGFAIDRLLHGALEEAGVDEQPFTGLDQRRSGTSASGKEEKTWS